MELRESCGVFLLFASLGKKDVELFVCTSFATLFIFLKERDYDTVPHAVVSWVSGFWLLASGPVW